MWRLTCIGFGFWEHGIAYAHIGEEEKRETDFKKAAA